MKKYKLFSGLFAAVLVLGACGSDEKDGEAETDAAKEQPQSEKSDTSKQVDEPIDEVDGVPIYEIGQTAIVKRDSGVEYQVTLNSMEFVTEYNGESAADTADLGTRIAVADYTVVNIGDQPLVPDFDTVIHFGMYE